MAQFGCMNDKSISFDIANDNDIAMIIMQHIS